MALVSSIHHADVVPDDVTRLKLVEEEAAPSVWANGDVGEEGARLQVPATTHIYRYQLPKAVLTVGLI